jgi:hypothetical protein
MWSSTHGDSSCVSMFQGKATPFVSSFFTCPENEVVKIPLNCTPQLPTMLFAYLKRISFSCVCATHDSQSHWWNMRLIQLLRWTSQNKGCPTEDMYLLWNGFILIQIPTSTSLLPFGNFAAKSYTHHTQAPLSMVQSPVNTTPYTPTQKNHCLCNECPITEA